MKTSVSLPLSLLSLLLCAVAAQTPNAIDRQSSIYPAVIFPRVFDNIVTYALETPIQIRAFFILNVGVWNAWCNYHPTAVDFFGRSRFKRPVSEHTTENKNIAVMFSLYRLYLATPSSFGGDSNIGEFRKIIEERGYDPDDESMDMTTPVGIGNRAGYDTARLVALDGWNANGDLTATQDNYKLPFQDFTGYTPMNNPWKIEYPFKWQPVLETNGKGFFLRQEHVVPQASSAMMFSMTREEFEKRKAPPPYHNSSATVGGEDFRDIDRIKRHAKNVFERSARLTEYQQIMAEYFDNKVKAFRTANDGNGILSIAAAIRFVVLPEKFDWNLDDDVIYGLGANILAYDATNLAWKEKRRIDAIRPTGQTMKLLFGDRKFKVWGGPGKKPVKITAGEWQPYLRTMPHAENPSGSSCLCSALIQHALIHAGNENDIPFSFTVPKGASGFYPGKVPSKDMEFTIEKLTDWSYLCGKSRLWAGVHFQPSVKGGRLLCRGIGRKAEDVVNSLLAGKPSTYWMEWLPAGTEKFWEA